jgi:hypothetical protein
MSPQSFHMRKINARFRKKEQSESDICYISS